MLYHVLLEFNNMLGFIEAAGVLVQIGIAILLCRYARDTYKLRKIAQEQIELMEKPCVVPNAQIRPQRVVGEVSDHITYQGVLQLGRYVQILNIGKGTAFDIEFEIQQQEEPKVSGKGHLPFLPHGENAYTAIKTDELITPKEHREITLKLSYVSQSGKSYTSLTQVQPIKNLAIVTDVSFD